MAVAIAVTRERRDGETRCALTPETAPVLAASAATQLPLFGRLWKLVREQAHQLVLFYVNRLVAHQTNVDRHLVSVANELTREIQEQQEQIRALQEEVEALRQKGNRS